MSAPRCGDHCYRGQVRNRLGRVGKSSLLFAVSSRTPSDWTHWLPFLVVLIQCDGAFVIVLWGGALILLTSAQAEGHGLSARAFKCG